MNKKNLMMLTIVLAVLVVSSGTVAVYMVVQNRSFPENKIRVACVGDSITGGTDYPSDLWMLLGSNYSVGNFGVGGSAASLDSLKPYMYENAFFEAKQFQPNIVIIMLGTNDANCIITPNNASFVESYVKLVEQFQGLQTKPQIYLVTPPPIFCNGTTPSAQYLESNIVPGVEQVANITNLPVIDVHFALANSSSCFPDGVHPVGEATQLIADTIYKAIAAQTIS